MRRRGSTTRALALLKRCTRRSTASPAPSSTSSLPAIGQQHPGQATRADHGPTRVQRATGARASVSSKTGRRNSVFTTSRQHCVAARGAP
jgi:hypothetical protein